MRAGALRAVLSSFPFPSGVTATALGSAGSRRLISSGLANSDMLLGLAFCGLCAPSLMWQGVAAGLGAASRRGTEGL